MTDRRFPVKRMALDAILVALYIGLSFLAIPLGGLKITVEALPVVICAVLFGPADAAIVGLLGELLNQMLSFGFTPTTALWVLPAVVRGAFLGLCLIPLKKRNATRSLVTGQSLIWLFVLCILSGIIVSCLNTFTLYVDSKMFGYYSYAMVFGVFWIRIGTGAISSSVMAAVTAPVVLALDRAKLLR